MIKRLFLTVILLLPLQFALNVGENIDLVTTRILVPVLFLVWLFISLAQKKIWIVNRAETWLILSFLFLSLFSVPVGLDMEKGLRKILYLFSVFPVYFVAADLLRDKSFQMKIIRIVWISGFLAAAIGIIQFVMPFLIGLDPVLKTWKSAAPLFLGSSFGELVTANPSWLVNISGNTWMRAFGFFPDPHMFSFFVSLCFFIGLGYFVWERNWKWKIFSGSAIIFMFSAVAFSFSRGAYLGMIAGGLSFLLIFLARTVSLKKIIIAGGILVILAFVFFRGTIQNRLASVFNLREGSNMERIKNWWQAAEVMRDHPFAGIGLGNYSSYVDPSASERTSIYAHNLFLDIAAETGILNGVLFLALVIVGARRGVRKNNFLGLGIASGLIYFFIHGIFDTPLWSPQVMVIFLVILALGVSREEFMLNVSKSAKI